jgi:FixJ family two-component response regulator
MPPGWPPRWARAPLLGEVRALARRARVRIAETETEAAASGIEALGLTQREREVLDLLADGRSNQQIAEELFHHPQDRERPRVEHPRQARRDQPRRGYGDGPPLGPPAQWLSPPERRV